MFCRNCGTKIADDGKFCPKCGTQILVAQTVQQQQDYGYPLEIEKPPVIMDQSEVEDQPVIENQTPYQTIATAPEENSSSVVFSAGRGFFLVLAILTFVGYFALEIMSFVGGLLWRTI